MYNDRDLAVIAAGAVMAILCLLLPIPFASKVGVGFFVLVLSVVLAFLRLGGDRLTIEEWARRRARYFLRPRVWTYHERELAFRPTQQKGQIDRPDQPVSPDGKNSEHKQETETDDVQLCTPSHVSISLEPVTAEKVARVLLGVVGVYFLYGLWSGGAADLAEFLKGYLP